MNDVAASVKEFYELIDIIVSKKPVLLRLSKSMADKDKIADSKTHVPRVKSNRKKPN